jgi:hypothetical protein
MLAHSTPAIAFLILFGMNATSAPPAAETVKQPWQWTTEERIAARTDVASRQSRRERYHVAHPATPPGGSAGVLPIDDEITGEHPELFLPTELFEVLTRSTLMTADATSEEFRKLARQKAAAVGLPPEFLDVVTAEAGEATEAQRRYLELMERVGRGARNEQALQAELAADVQDLCVKCAASVRRLRARYGQRFDQFLYTAVAPIAFRTSFGPGTTAGGLRRQELGCP